MRGALITFGALTLLGLLAACVSGKPPSAVYTDHDGKQSYVETDREQCERACNDDYARCMDTHEARNTPVSGAPEGLYGASADCRVDLSKCLPGCQAR